MKDGIKNTAAPAAEEGKAGYKRPPVKSRFPKGKSGNPFGRKKGSAEYGNCSERGSSTNGDRQTR
jgi:hypothetical protein